MQIGAAVAALAAWRTAGIPVEPTTQGRSLRRSVQRAGSVQPRCRQLLCRSAATQFQHLPRRPGSASCQRQPAATAARLSTLSRSAGVLAAVVRQRRPVADRIVEAVWGFFAAYALVFVVIMLLLLMTGLDNITAFTATAACLNNLGPGLGEVAANFGAIPDSSKWLLIVAMVFGRLEVFTLLVLFTPAFWKD